MKFNISAIKAKFSPAQTESEDVIPVKEMCLLDHIEKIIEISRKYGIKKCLVKGKCHLDYVCAKLGIAPVQAVLFSLFMEKAEDNRIQISEIAESIKCSKLRIIKYMNECDELEKKRLIRCSRSDDGVSYRVPREVWDSMRKNNEFVPQKIDNLSIYKLFKVFKRIFKERKDNELSYDSMKMELLEILNLNMHLLFCQKIMSYNLDEDELMLLLCFCHLFGNNNDDNIMSHDLEFLYGDEDVEFGIEALSNGCHPLMDAKFFEYNNDRGFFNTESWKLSDKAKKELMTEFKGNRNCQKNLILFDAIKPKTMYYNSRETGEIQKLISLLSDENYRKIQDRLDGKGMRKGFACLFSGGPGTGKTETAYQIARETKRNIMMVNISETKSCWYGESEKKIKEIFDTYRTAVDNSNIAPILLFNEADAVIGRRKEISSSNPSIDQTENTIQNIILSEMENLSGIMIATSNLTQNMDKAFERRFLYKITFDKPGPESRIGIWNSLLPGLAAEYASELSSRFELSGGQIENIARKTEVDDIINGSGLSMDTLMRYCKAEILNDFNTGIRIGFAHE